MEQQQWMPPEERRQMSSGPGDVLQLIRRSTANTRREIQQVTGLSRVTVAQRVETLMDARLIAEVAGGGGATGGRRPGHLEFDVERSVLVVAAVDTAHSRTALTDLSGRILETETLDVSIREGPKVVLAALTASMRRLIEVAADGRTVAGAGISVPGPVDPKTRRPSQPPIMPGWDGYPITDHVGDTIPVPIFVENDADAMAFGEQSTNFSTSTSVCLVKVSTGIGSGLVINGSVYHGIDGGAGDIGHIRIAGEDALCQCGSRGCLAAIASGRAIAIRLSDGGTPARSGRDVRRLLQQGDTDALRLTHEAGVRIGEVMATVVSMINPGVLIVSGDLASSALLAGLREGLYPRSLPRATRNLVVCLGALDANAGMIGMARIVTDSLFSAEAINHQFR
ncbi:MAG: sugar kinase [Candidatus Lumbricidophila eiseniae]|uniref:Sugar kinase n=1 Tax=Candidatus Lumbricidiphila eiseniae TaxID=1969409 RepID=A0A2A6FRD3_9MICO|nr:MAG: sugar kinase [Candidatus Lumbricidophila eiseniae]